MLSNTSDGWQSGLYLRSDASGFPRLSLLAPTGALGEAVSIDSAAKVGIGNIAPVAQLDVYSQSAARVGQVIRAASGQTANLQEWQNDAGTIQARVTSGGSIVTTQGFAVLGGASISGSIAALFQSATASRIPVVVQGAASQTANLQEWQNSAGTVRARVDANGNVFGAVIAGNNSLVFMRELENGGLFEAKKLTATVANPGANSGRIYFRDGTTAGTLKLVVRAGAAGAETTILDNIPQ
jgi:hypothetical protein